MCEYAFPDPIAVEGEKWGKYVSDKMRGIICRHDEKGKEKDAPTTIIISPDPVHDGYKVECEGREGVVPLGWTKRLALINVLQGLVTSLQTDYYGWDRGKENE